MSMSSLGSSTFTVSANTASFEAGMKRVEAMSKRAAQTMTRDLGGMTAANAKRFAELNRTLDQLSTRLDYSAKSSRFGLGLLALGNMVDDLQYGFRSIVNNIPQLVYFMGGSAGLAGASAIAAVAVNQLVQNWGKLTDAMQGAWLNVPADHLEKLRIRAEKAADAFDKLMAAPSKVEAKQIDALTTAMQEAPRGGQRMVLKGIREAVEQDKGLRAQLGPGDAVEMAKRVTLEAGKDAWLFRRGRGLEEIKRKVRADLLREKNEETARQLMGQALLPGEQGVSARATMGRLIEKFKDSFPEKFRKAFAGTTEEAVEHQDANQAAARMMMQGPIGTQMMLGGGGKPAGPVTMAQARAMLKQNPLLRRLNPRAAEDLAKHLVGMSPEQAAEVMSRMTPAKIQEHANKMAGGRVGPGAADLMIGTARAVREAGPIAAKPGALEQTIGAALKAAGIEGDAAGTLKEMRKLQTERVKALMAEQGLTRQQAQYVMLQEQQQRRFPGSMQPAQWVGAAEFAKMTAPIPELPDLARKQLTELTAIRTALVAMAMAMKKPAPPAQAGP